MQLPGAPTYPPEYADRYLKNHWWPGITFGEMLDRTTDLYPTKEALVAGERRFTYLQLREWSDRAALAFLEAGLGRLDRVLLQLPNWPEFVFAYFGLQKIGAIPVFCLPRYSLREMEHFAAVTESRAWIGPLRFEKTDYEALIQGLQSRCPSLEKMLVIPPSPTYDGPLPSGTLSFNHLLNCSDPASVPADHLPSFKPEPGEICHLMPTGGTTGRPKIVPRTHNDFLCNVEFRARAWERSARDITLIATPLTHNMAIEVSLNPTILFGGKVVLLPSTRPKEILEAIERERITTTILVVAQLHAILDYPDLKEFNLSSLQVIAGAGSHVPAELVQRVRDRIGCKFYNVYGSSEGPCAQTRYEDPDEAVRQSVGRPICPYDEFKLIDPAGQDLPPTAEGELVTRGPCIFRGYYRSEEENRLAFTPDGFFRTGDIARFDPEGRIILTGRRKDIIIRGGENIGAREVEELVGGHPQVEQVSVVGMSDPTFGEKVCAFVKPSKGAAITLEDILSYLRRQKVSVLFFPERLETVEELPLTPVGKVDKKRLREIIQEKLRRERQE